MSALERLAGTVLILVLVLMGAWFGIRHYGVEQRQAGYAAAVADGKEAREVADLAALAIESGLRTRLLDQDTAAFNQERKHAESLQAAQRRMRAGVDSLRCPAAGPIPSGTPAGGGSAAAGAAADGEGLAMVPDVAADVLGLAADHQRLLRNYQRVVDRFEACRAVNAQ